YGPHFTAFASAALLAAHLAFMAAASCARRSGERFSFLFAFLADDFFASAIRAAAERAADFLAAFNAFTASAISRLRFSTASFCWPSCRRLSSRLIFFLKSFIFMNVCSRSRLSGIAPCWRAAGARQWGINLKIAFTCAAPATISRRWRKFPLHRASDKIRISSQIGRSFLVDLPRLSAKSVASPRRESCSIHHSSVL